MAGEQRSINGGEVSSTPSRMVVAGTVVALVAIVLVVLGFVLIGQREWSCQYRYWSDGQHNDKADVPAILAVVGVVVGVIVAATCLIAYLRLGHRASWLWPIALGATPLAIAIVILLVTGGNPGYDCTTG
jgi:hypothetical protein